MRVEHRQAFNLADSVTTLLAHNLRSCHAQGCY
ncbi:Uncharacterised protein [Vibrio cholerae]|nr:Uncharacterised protein [Vibrio cholerae]